LLRLTCGRNKGLKTGSLLALALALTVGFPELGRAQTTQKQDSKTQSQDAQGQSSQSQSTPTRDEQDDIPDAPSASRPPQPLPPVTPTARPENAPPSTQQPALPPSAPIPGSQTEASQPPPPFKMTTVPEGSVTGQPTVPANMELQKIVVNVNQVVVPVMVKDESGHLVSGLVHNDFEVFENGVKQKMNFFTSDPIALSAAIVLDLSMPDSAVQKVDQTFSALEGAFSPYDEVAVYTYSSSVSKQLDFGAAGRKLDAVFNELKLVRGHNNGPPVLNGPLGPQGPTIDGQSVDPNVPMVITPPRESHVLNDAILAAALDLSRRQKDRRKVIFVISDGRESRSDASYRDVLKILLTNNIMVFGVGVEGAAIPIYGKLQKLKLPKLTPADILPKYANATGGEIFTGFSADAIGNTYARALGEARNQYTLGYQTRATPSSSYREIEVKVARPDCSQYSSPCVRVYAKAGYYPLPPGR
jgi:VWFA-related protein